MTEDLKHLGSATRYVYDTPDKSILETVPVPKGHGELFVPLMCNEFTTLCPVTGQPDYGKILIEYIPRDKLVESKSLKLFLGSFRQSGNFHEAAVRIIADALIDVLNPFEITVTGKFESRGGISINPRVYYRDDKTPV